MTSLAVIACVTLTFAGLTSVTSAQGTSGLEVGQVGARYANQKYNQDQRGAQEWDRDSQTHAGNLGRTAVWTGRAGERDDNWRRNQRQFRDQASNKRQQYSNDNKNFGNIVNQIRDEGLRNSIRLNDASRYVKNDQEAANGFNNANARKNAFDRGNDLNDNINYRFNKQFNKQSSENGGFEDENGRQFTKVDLIDEREKDQVLNRADNAVQRRQNDKQQAIKETDWRAKANQAKANAGQYGFGDRRLEAAGERSDERAIDYNRKDNQFRENEVGVDSATRLAKDLAEQAAGYRNEAGANADATRAVTDGKSYAGTETAPAGGAAGYAHGAAGVAGAGGDTSRRELTGGEIDSGFAENADQRERGEELARATALSAADARNEYQRLKDRVVYDEVKGLKDRAEGAFRQGLSDSANQGFSSNAAEAAKHAQESDRNFAGAASSSQFAANQKALNEALRDRDYFLKKQNDENETYTRRKQFFHNKKEGGSNDEALQYDRNKKAREFGAAEEADLAKQNTFARSNQNAKIAVSARDFEDTANKRAQLQHAQEDRIQDASGTGVNAEQEAARAGADVQNYDRRANWQTADDSRSEQVGRKQNLWEEQSEKDENNKLADQHAQNTQADVQVVTVGGEGPFGAINSREILGKNPLQVEFRKEKQVKKIPDINIDIEPVQLPKKFEAPKKELVIAPLPSVEPVKAYHPVKYNKKKVDYSTHYKPSSSRYRPQGSLYGQGFQRIGNSIFDRRSDRFAGINNIARGKATSAFRKPALSFGQHRRTNPLGSLTRFGRR